MEYLKDSGLANELESARWWFDNERRKLEDELKTNKKDHQNVNIEGIIEDYFEDKQDPISKGLRMIGFSEVEDNENTTFS